MKSRALGLALAAVLAVLMAGDAFGLEAAAVARLKKAGVSDETLQLMIREKSVETAAFSVDEIVDMKRAGVGEKALQALIAEGSFIKDREPLIFGSERQPLRLASAVDIIALKEAGVSDEVLRAVVDLSRPSSESERDRAMRLLKEMGLWVQLRP